MALFQITDVEADPQVVWDVLRIDYLANYPFPYFFFMLAPVGETIATHKVRVGVIFGIVPIEPE